MEGEKRIELLNADEDRHGGVVVSVEEPMDSMLFSSILEASLYNWNQQVHSLVTFSLQRYLFSTFSS